MDNSNTQSSNVQGTELDALQNQLGQVEEAISGLRTAYGILSGYHSHLSAEYSKLTEPANTSDV